jgi:peptidoglycan-associated lipoprotein
MSVRFVLLIVSAMFVACSAEKKATKAFRLGKYQNSIDAFKKIASNNPNNGRANYFIAESYRLSNRIKEAEPYYAKAGGRAVDKDSIQFYYAQSLKANGKYAEAKTQLEELSKETTINGLKDRARAEIKGIDYLAGLGEKPNYYRVKNMDLINTPSSEYSPVFLNNELYFTSSRGND